MKKPFFSLVAIIICEICFSQVSIAPLPEEYKDYLKIDTELQKVYDLWNLYLTKRSENNSEAVSLWNPDEVKKYKSYDIFESASQFHPSFYSFNLQNQLSYIRKIEDGSYRISSHYYWIDDDKLLHFYLTQNVMAKKINGQYYLSNYLLESTKNWEQKKVGLINYHYPVDYNFNKKNAKEADKTIQNVFHLFDIKPFNVDYYISNNCSQKSEIIGMSDEIVGNILQRCAAYDLPNRTIYTTAYSGENHRHELIHVINEKYKDAHYLLLTGLAIYSKGEDVHLGMSFHYIFEKLNQYLEKNDVRLNFVDDFPKFDSNIGSEYAFGAILIDMILEKGNISLLKNALEKIKNDEDLNNFIKNELQISNDELSNKIREKVKEFASLNFKFKINL
ncbi:MAG: hypothetical protein LBE36_13010 [Flavobacteriaceae bacterium]|jgi:hypothetical protein|nr:hypothetical protein [Flavobacteriaceae bacterium]